MRARDWKLQLIILRDWQLRLIVHKNVIFQIYELIIWCSNAVMSLLDAILTAHSQVILQFNKLKLILVLSKSHLWITYTVDNCEWSPRDTISHHTWPHVNHWRSIDNAKNCDNCTYEPWAWKVYILNTSSATRLT